MMKSEVSDNAVSSTLAAATSELSSVHDISTVEKCAQFL